MLKEFEAEVADLRHRREPVFWPIFVPKAEHAFRWRAELQCGCIHVVLTHGEDRYPDQGSSTDPLSGHRLPVGEYWCPGDHDMVKPYREIIEWRAKKVREFPPDPEEPQHGLDPES